MLVVLMFGLRCLGPCPVSAQAMSQVERQVVRSLAELELTVKPAPMDALRPTGPDAFDVRQDVARLYGADRAVAFDLDPKGPVLWATWFAKGVVGPWRVSKVNCEIVARRLNCGRLTAALRQDARPRQATEVNVLGALRRAGPGVGKCVAAEKRRPLSMRLFGRIELELIVPTTGKVQVSAIAPARAAKSKLGRCLRKVMNKLDVGTFQGSPLKMRIPVDL